MSFLARIAQQAQSAAITGHVTARPKGPLPSPPTMATPVDRPAHGEPVASQSEPSVATPEAVPPTAVGLSDEPPPARSTAEPDSPTRPDQSALDHRLAAVACTAGTRPEAVDGADLDRPAPPAVADGETVDQEASSRRDEEPVVRVDAASLGTTAAPSADDQRDDDDKPPTEASGAEPSPAPRKTSPNEISRRQPAEPAPIEPAVGRPGPAAAEQEIRQAKLPPDQAVTGADTDQGELQAQPAHLRWGEADTNARRPEPPPILEPVSTPQPEPYRPTPTIQPPAPEQPPLLQIDQIDVVVTDPAPAQPAAPGRSRLAAISASRRYLRRL